MHGCEPDRMTVTELTIALQGVWRELAHHLNTGLAEEDRHRYMAAITQAQDWLANPRKPVEFDYNAMRTSLMASLVTLLGKTLLGRHPPSEAWVAETLVELMKAAPVREATQTQDVASIPTADEHEKSAAEFVSDLDGILLKHFGSDVRVFRARPELLSRVRRLLSDAAGRGDEDADARWRKKLAAL